MHPARPLKDLGPCDTCGTQIDRARAPRTEVYGGNSPNHSLRIKHFCSDSCANAYEPLWVAPVTKEPEQSDTDRVREATIPRISLPGPGATAAHRAVYAPEPVPLPAPGLLLSITALVLAFFAEDTRFGIASAACSVAASVLCIVNSKSAQQSVGVVAWLAGPLGVVLAAIAGLVACFDGGKTGGLIAASVAAGAIVARSWLDIRARRPVAESVHNLTLRVPTSARVSMDNSGRKRDDETFEEAPVSELDVGAEVLVLEGETLAVDGVVTSGQATVVKHPGGTPTKIRAGAALFAGTFLKDGSIRVVASRVGETRGFLRPAGFGEVDGPDAAQIGRIADQVTRYGGLAALIAAPMGIALTGDPGLAGRISAAAAVLLAVPLVAARRSAESPFIAAAASALSRGIAFATPRAIEDAGRVSTTAIFMNGVITEGAPEVVEVHAIADISEETLLALLMGTEAARSAQDTPAPSAAAIRRFARARNIDPVAMRQVRHAPGHGVAGTTVDGDVFVAGNRQFLLEEGVSVALADGLAQRAEKRGQQTVFVGFSGRVKGIVVLEDPVRPGARAAVQRLFDLGGDVVLLSRDHRGTVEAIAGPLDVTNVRAELLESEEHEAVARMKEAGGLVAVVGRADNDSPLEAASVPVVLNEAAVPSNDLGINVATLDVRDASAALWIARVAREEASRGVFLAVGVGGVLMLGAVFGWLNPAIAACLAAVVDAITLPAGARLLRRLNLRLPAR